MDFGLSEEQRMLQSTVRRFVESCYSFEQRRQIQASPLGFNRDHWAQFADLGILAIPFAEAEGGLGGSGLDVAIVMHEFGRGLVLEPYFATVVLAGGLLRHGGSAAQRAALIPHIIGGQCICAFAYGEAAGRYNLGDVRLTATRRGGSFILNGEKLAVYAAAAADWIFVTARTGGAERDADGITLFRIHSSTAGVSRRDYVNIDGARASDVIFQNVRATSEDVVGAVDGGLPIVQRVVDEAIAALCAEAVGAMAVLNEATIEYSRQRRAFGQTLSKFQVIQHRLVNMKMAGEQAAALAFGAALALGAPETERTRIISAAKVKIGKESRTVAQGAVQLHGGVGITDELSIGHYMKRLLAIEALFGNTPYHLRRYVACGREAA